MAKRETASIVEQLFFFPICLLFPLLRFCEITGVSGYKILRS
jgi:hypothetical protein